MGPIRLLLVFTTIEANVASQPAIQSENFRLTSDPRVWLASGMYVLVTKFITIKYEIIIIPIYNTLLLLNRSNAGCTQHSILFFSLM